MLPVAKAILTPPLGHLPPCLTFMLASDVCVGTATGLCCVFLLEYPGQLLEHEQELNVYSSIPRSLPRSIPCSLPNLKLAASYC